MPDTRPVLVFALLACLCLPACSAAEPDAARAEMIRLLQKADPNFSHEIGLLGGFKNQTAYHTGIPVGAEVHKTRESAAYALACLDVGGEWRKARAVRVLNALFDLQDRDPESPSCGVWPWYYEEPISRMKHPDPNWADFIGVQFVEIEDHHGDRLPPEVRARLRESILLAARAIVKRNVHPAYTNIAVMGTYVVTTAGRL